MVHLGQKYRKVGEDGVWEVMGLSHKGDWFLSKVGSGSIEAVHERHLENGTEWTPVSDDA